MALQQPIPYYIHLLSQADKPTKEIVTILIDLVDTEKEQKCFQQLFIKTTNPAVKAQLAKVLKQITLAVPSNDLGD